MNVLIFAPERSYSSVSIRTHIATVLLIIACFDAIGQGTTHTCGATNVHNPAISYGRVTDIDGNAYKTVVIDDLVWFAENLRVTRFQNGDGIPNVSDSAAWSILTGPGMCSYRNDTRFDCPQGKLYNFFVASDSRNPCPTGWRVPTQYDFNKLINRFDPAANGGAPSSLPNHAGGALKSTGISYWRSPNLNAMNISGFSALPNGDRADFGPFSTRNNEAASYWYSTQVPLGPVGGGLFLQLAYPQDYAVRNAFRARYGVCIRCVADKNSLPPVDSNAEREIVLFPNPATTQISLRVKGFGLPSHFELINSLGQILQQKNIIDALTIINISRFSNGVYYVKVYFNNESVSKKLIISR
jgi:uncharacterized protein (TIGR02145 family)